MRTLPVVVEAPGFDLGAANPITGFGSPYRSRIKVPRGREPAVERPVLDGFGELDRADLFAVREVGQGAGDLEDAVEGAGGEAELLEGGIEQGPAGRVHLAVTPE